MIILLLIAHKTGNRSNKKWPCLPNRLAHMTHMDSCLRDFSSGFPTFYYILIRFVLRKPSTPSEISRSSVARPWLSDLTVQGSNPINAKSFFHSFQIKRLRDSIDGYCEIAL